jgi:hypothetical protein
MAIPDFSLAPPAQVSLPTSGVVASVGSLKVSRNQAFSGQVTLSTFADTGDPAHPLTLGTLLGPVPFTYARNPVTPTLGTGATVNVTNATTSGATPGIHTVWVQGLAGSPYLTVKREPMAIKVGTVTRDFAFISASQSETALTSGATVVFNLVLQNSPNTNTNFGNPVTLSVDGPLPAGMGPVTFGSTSVTPTKAGAPTTLSVSTGTIPAGQYDVVVRATGWNADAVPRQVTHLLRLTVYVAPAGSKNDEYVDIVGFAVMRIAASDSNAIHAYAITPVIPDINDDRLRRGQVARLVPWD